MLHPIKQTQANILKFKGLTAPFPTHFILKVPMMLGEPTQFRCLPCSFCHPFQKVSQLLTCLQSPQKDKFPRNIETKYTIS